MTGAIAIAHKRMLQRTVNLSADGITTIVFSTVSIKEPSK